MARPKPLKKYDLCPDGVPVVVDWDQFFVGSSFFVPCIDTENCKEQVLKIAREKKFTVELRRRIEDGKWGVRFWRTL